MTLTMEGSIMLLLADNIIAVFKATFLICSITLGLVMGPTGADRASFSIHQLLNLLLDSSLLPTFAVVESRRGNRDSILVLEKVSFCSTNRTRTILIPALFYFVRNLTSLSHSIDLLGFRAGYSLLMMSFAFCTKLLGLTSS